MAAVLVPLFVLLALQYWWLGDLERNSAIAREATLENYVEAVAKNPKNRFRIAHGNGAPPVDRKKLMRYFNMDHIYELYGSTEAAINTVTSPARPESLTRAEGF